MIYIDTHGSGEHELYNLLKLKNVDVELRHIDSGDIFFNDVILERKTITDLVNSVTIGSRHLWEQLRTMKETYKKYALVIEGFNHSYYKDKMVMGILYSITIGWEIPFFPTTSIYETAELIKILYDKSNMKHGGPPPPAIRKETSIKEIQWCCLQNIRGIGTAKARDILKEVKFTDLCKGKVKRIKCLNEKLSDKVISVFTE